MVIIIRFQSCYVPVAGVAGLALLLLLLLAGGWGLVVAPGRVRVGVGVCVGVLVGVGWVGDSLEGGCGSCGVGHAAGVGHGEREGADLVGVGRVGAGGGGVWGCDAYLGDVGDGDEAELWLLLLLVVLVVVGVGVEHVAEEVVELVGVVVVVVVGGWADGHGGLDGGRGGGGGGGVGVGVAEERRVGVVWQVGVAMNSMCVCVNWNEKLVIMFFYSNINFCWFCFGQLI